MLEFSIKSILTNLTEKSSNCLRIIGISIFNKIKEFDAFLYAKIRLLLSLGYSI